MSRKNKKELSYTQIILLSIIQIHNDNLNLLKLNIVFKERIRLYFHCRPHYKVGVVESRLDGDLKGLGMFFQLQDIFSKFRLVTELLVFLALKIVCVGS